MAFSKKLKRQLCAKRECFFFTEILKIGRYSKHLENLQENA